jgi:hypothetical protein
VIYLKQNKCNLRYLRKHAEIDPWAPYEDRFIFICPCGAQFKASIPAFPSGEDKEGLLARVHAWHHAHKPPGEKQCETCNGTGRLEGGGLCKCITESGKSEWFSKPPAERS